MINKLTETELTWLEEEIEDNTECLTTTEEDEVLCISIENLEGILKRHINKRVKLNKF